jgi:hypothetical protein
MYLFNGARGSVVVNTLAKLLSFASAFYATSRVSMEVSEDRSRSYFTTDGQSVSMSWYRAPLWDLQPDITSCRNVAVWNLRSCFCGAPSLARGRVCNLQCNQWRLINLYHPGQWLNSFVLFVRYISNNHPKLHNVGNSLSAWNQALLGPPFSPNSERVRVLVVTCYREAANWA